MPVATKVQLTGGNFQDSEGNLLALGYLTMKLSQDGSVTGVGQVCAGIEITITLDANGAVVAGQSVWANSDITPANTYYRVTGWTAKGQVAWGPNNQQVSSGGSFDVGTWSPNQVISWVPPIQVPVLEVNGTLLSGQNLQNLKDSDTVTFTDEGSGAVKAHSSGSAFTGKFFDYATYSSQTGIGPSDGQILLVPFSLSVNANFSHIVVDRSNADTNHAHLYDVGIYTPAGVLKADIGGQFMDPTGAWDKAFVQGSVAFTPGEYLFAVCVKGSSPVGTVKVNQNAGISIGYTTATLTTAGTLPASIVVVEGAAASGFGNPPLTPLIILY